MIHASSINTMVELCKQELPELPVLPGMSIRNPRVPAESDPTHSTTGAILLVNFSPLVLLDDGGQFQSRILFLPGHREGEEGQDGKERKGIAPRDSLRPLLQPLIVVHCSPPLEILPHLPHGFTLVMVDIVE
jgi:hypothetical protein